MSVNAKHLATFLLGAAAGATLYKFMKTEQGEQLLDDLKEKATTFKTEAEEAVEKAPEYFEQLKNQSADSLKENFPEAEKLIRELLDTLAGKTKGQSPEAS